MLREGLVPEKLQNGDFARVVDVDYRTAEVTLEVPEESKAVIGSRYTLRNLDADVFEKSQSKDEIVAEVTSRDKGTVVCRLTALHGKTSKPVSTEIAMKLIHSLIDPGAGFSYGVEHP
jgi:hypothetical protein